LENPSLAVVVLAAGKGKRMKSELPKVLHGICGRPLIDYVMDAVSPLEAGEVVVVVGAEPDAIRAELGEGVTYVEQVEPKGTGHAVVMALDALGPEFEELLVLPGDSPLITPDTLAALVEARRREDAAASLLSTRLEKPTGYGRVVRDADGFVERIVEEADAGEVERAIKEVNACTYAFERALLEPALANLTTANAQGEYYLTDVVESLVAGRLRVCAVKCPAEEALGVNDREQLAEAAAVARARINRSLMLDGVTIVDPGRTYIDFGVEVGRDTVIMPLVFITGASRIGGDCLIGPCTAINESSMGDGCRVEFSWLDGCELAEGVTVGPYSRIRKGTRLGPSSKAGSFVEMKNTVVGEGSKVPHLSYMGDAEIGEGANVGAGSITCNFDGESKHRTVIGDRAFLGSDTMLIAPVRVGDDAVTGAGSTIYEDVPDGSLAIERSEQKIIPGWRARKGKRSARDKGKGRSRE
jgi:bifunctional UDP-N-acetylglucosamine pyrophosphorylase/glucosamine-1-phosphate N-acetyltransferase